MPRIKLANWYGDRKPGDEMDVDDVLLKALSRDGIVAEVLDAPAEPGLTPQQDAPAQPEPAVHPVDPAAETGRKRR
jgi:hypothetical protein